MSSASFRPAVAIESIRPRAEAPRPFVNRELSFLEFNQLVLDEAADPAVPLLERLKFVSIVSANLDEFFMIRVAGLKQQLGSGVREAGPDGLGPAEVLAAINERVARQVVEQERVLLESVLPAMAAEGLHLADVADLDAIAQAEVLRRFEREIFPMLTPLAVDPGHPFPLIKNRSLNLAIHLVPQRASDGAPLTSLVQVPQMLPRFIEVSRDGVFRAVLIEDVITEHVAALFPGMIILECVPFRVVRNWDLSFDEDEQEDLMEAVEKELRRRARLAAVRLEIAEAASDELVRELSHALGMGPADVQRHGGPLALVDLAALLERIARSELRDPEFVPQMPPELRETEDLFAEIAKRDILLHHPYESYAPVVDLLAQAARDPAVLAIKQTLYRTTPNSPLVRSLITAAENGKQVTALVELKARFTEETNMVWARALEEAGVHVVYGMAGLKTHCKVTLVVRREAAGLRRYVHIGTGNYNEKTASVYSDLSFFSAREDVGADLSALFNILTGYSDPPAWRKLVVAPMDLRRRVLELIELTRAAAKRGAPAKIVIKSNALIDQEVVRALQKASQSGVEVVLLIRGPCALRVGIPGVSEGIVVRTIVDRFLEHARVLYFAAEGREDVFITSTDIMPRNFDRRVEVMVPIEDETLKRRIVQEILATELADDTKASLLEPSGAYRRLASKASRTRAQQAFMRLALGRGDEDQGRSRKGGRKKHRSKH
jgi:polyphosphate kinase